MHRDRVCSRSSATPCRPAKVGLPCSFALQGNSDTALSHGDFARAISAPGTGVPVRIGTDIRPIRRATRTYAALARLHPGAGSPQLVRQSLANAIGVLMRGTRSGRGIVRNRSSAFAAAEAGVEHRSSRAAAASDRLILYQGDHHRLVHRGRNDFRPADLPTPAVRRDLAFGVGMGEVWDGRFITRLLNREFIREWRGQVAPVAWNDVCSITGLRDRSSFLVQGHAPRAANGYQGCQNPPCRRAPAPRKTARQANDCNARPSIRSSAGWKEFIEATLEDARPKIKTPSRSL